MINRLLQVEQLPFIAGRFLPPVSREAHDAAHHEVKTVKIVSSVISEEAGRWVEVSSVGLLFVRCQARLWVKETACLAAAA